MTPPLTHPEEDEHNHIEWCPAPHPSLLQRIDRRTAVRILSMSAVAAASGCGSSSSLASGSGGSGIGTATTTALSVSNTAPAEGVSDTLTATVSPSAATGTITFYDGTTPLGSDTLASGIAAISTAFNTTGAQILTAVYSGSTTYAASTSAAVTVTVSAAAACSASLEGEEGPYFVDDSATGYLRTNILTNLDGTSAQTGVPLTLSIYVFDSEKSCAAMQGVQVDIWQCNAAGVYSAESSESTTSQSWLRGYQLTDATGKVQFTTILPGWYSGRTNHIHLRFRSSYDQTDTSGSNTMQIFFDQTLINTLSTSVAPYSSEGTNPTTNASDRVYSTEEDGTTLLSLSGNSTSGYTATFNAYMPV